MKTHWPSSQNQPVPHSGIVGQEDRSTKKIGGDESHAVLRGSATRKLVSTLKKRNRSRLSLRADSVNQTRLQPDIDNINSVMT